VTFTRPLLLIAGIVALVLLVASYRFVERRRSAQALAYSNLTFALDAMRGSRLPGALLGAAFTVGAGALLLALAGPHLVTNVPTKDGTVLLCIDTSGSMRAEDVAPTRAEAASEAARTFIDSVPDGTKIGIVSFSSSAEVVAPPTADLDAARDALARIPPPDGGTAIGDALALATQQMPKTGHRIIVLLTDGVNNLGTDPIGAARNAAAQGILIETVGVGSSGSGQLIPGTGEPAELDAIALRTIAETTGGRYAQADNADGLREAFRHIALGTVWERKRIDGSLAFALGGGLLLVIAFLSGLAAGKL